jgi:general secretion pathway protein J
MGDRLRQRGFTLLEIIVALAIFAILSTLAYRALSALIQTREQVMQETRKWREVMLFFSHVEQNLRQHVGRTARDAQGESRAEWIGRINLASQDEARLEFSRLGAADRTGFLADTRRIGYRLKSGTIEEMIWPAMDVAPNSEPTTYPVLGNVKRMDLHYLVAEGNRWVDEWPLQEAKALPCPAAVEMIVTLQSGEVLTRIISLI